MLYLSVAGVLGRHPASVRLVVLLSADVSISAELSTSDLSESMTVSVSLALVGFQ